MRFDNNSTGERMNQRWMPAKNVGSVTIPPFGLVEITTSTNPSPGVVVYSVRRPTTSGSAASLLAVNGPTPIPANKHGSVTQDYPVFALYNTGDGTPAQGESWGSLINTFTLSKGKPGFTIVGQTLGSGTAARVRVQSSPPNQMEVVQVWGNGTAGAVVSDAFLSGRIRTASLGSAYAVGDDCYLTAINFHDIYSGAFPMVEGTMLHGRYLGSYDGGSGARPTFDVRSPVTKMHEVCLSLSSGWTVTSDAATLVPLDTPKPYGYDETVNIVYANTTPASDSSKIYLPYVLDAYHVSFSLSLALPSSVAGTKFAQNSQFRFFPFTVTPYLDGNPISGAGRSNHLWVPPSSITTGAASAGTAHTHDTTFTVENVTTDDNFAGCVVNVAGNCMISASEHTAGSYVQLFIETADDAIVLAADLWVRSAVIAFQ